MTEVALNEMSATLSRLYEVITGSFLPEKKKGRLLRKAVKAAKIEKQWGIKMPRKATDREVATLLYAYFQWKSPEDWSEADREASTSIMAI